MTSTQLPLIMLRCLLLTILIEGILAAIAGVRTKRGQLVVLLANILTNPLVVSLSYLSVYLFGQKYFYPAVLVLEIAAVLAEALVYRQQKIFKKNPLLLSVFLNFSSYAVGILINKILY